MFMTSTQSVAQEEHPQASPGIASGTLNLVLANRNGFVVAADSRMSSEHTFLCDGKPQLYCDNSQKLFRTTPNSAMVIAGFAVGRYNSPLDLTVASVIRKQFGLNGLPNDDQADSIAAAADNLLQDALTGVAAMSDPVMTSAQSLSLWATFVRFDSDRAPVVQVDYFAEEWKPTGPRNVMAPTYVVKTAKKKVTEFFYLPVGITCVADAIFSGHYRTTHPAIRRYYRKRLNKELLDGMTLEEMLALARAILLETKKYTDLVGGEDQIGRFPATTGGVRWSLPANLPSEAQLKPRVMRWDGLTCSNAHGQPCGVAPVSFFVSSEQPANESFKKFFLASQFNEIPVALDNNLFVGNTFEHVTLRWLGNPFFMRRNIFSDCVLELPNAVELPRDSELNGKCRVERNSRIDIYTIVGAPLHTMPSPCIRWNPDHSCAQYGGFGLPRQIQP
jgi:hypothetical protein